MKTSKLGMMALTVTLLAFLGQAYGQAACPAPQPQQIGSAITFHGNVAWQGVPIGSPVPVRRDLQFTLSDAVGGGNQVGPTLCFTNTPALCTAGAVVGGGPLLVVDGHVAVSLDFGAVYDGDERWLGVEIYDAVFGWQTLSPRLQIGPTSYAQLAVDVVDNAVSNAKLSDDAVCTDKIADDAVTEPKIALNAVTSWQIASNAVGSSELANSAVQTAHLGIGSVTTSKIADGTIIADDIANNTVTAGKLSAAGVPNGLVLTASGGTVQWNNPPTASLTLPYTGNHAGNSTAFTINQSGSIGIAGDFNITSGSNATAVRGATNGGGSAVTGWNTGTGRAGFFEIGNSASTADALYARTIGTGSAGLMIVSNSASASPALFAQTNSSSMVSSNAAVLGRATSTTGLSIGIRGESLGTTANSVGVFGLASSFDTAATFGVAGQSNSSQGTGVQGVALGANGRGVVGRALGGPNAVGIRSEGDCEIVGNLSKSSGTFKIDHPLDPENKYLLHSFVESPDMMNIYNGLVTLDDRGTATVDFPAWFEALNRDFRYQLTPIGTPGPDLYVAREVEDNWFAIAGGTPGARVSWQVTGIRHDPYADAHPIRVEMDKPNAEKGYYRHPEVYGYGPEKSISFARDPEGMSRLLAEMRSYDEAGDE